AFFLLGYAAIRASLELVRQPDQQFLRNDNNGAVFLGMTMGQTLSAGLVIGALLIFLWPRRRDAGSAASTP
ncbi:MAG: prolipoprotein diacylglyceryl transferase family protein, partial [Planctomycetota bacterium]